MNFRINILKSEIHVHTHLKVQFQLHTKHFISMTKPTTEYCLQKKLLFVLSHIRNINRHLTTITWFVYQCYRTQHLCGLEHLHILGLHLLL